MDHEVKILVVDDEDRIRRLLKMYLEREHYIVEEAENGEIALQLAKEQDYDLILLDLMMPGMDGIEVLQQLRKEKATPVAILTAKAKKPTVCKGLRKERMIISSNHSALEKSFYV